MKSGLRPHVAWGLLGAATIPAAWWAWSAPGAAALVACIALAFVGWYRIGSRGSWMALVVLGLGMSGILGWQAASADAGGRCPAPGTSVYLKLNKPKVNCDEIRAGSAVMSFFFGLVGLLGIGAPIYARGMRDEDEGPVRT